MARGTGDQLLYGEAPVPSARPPAPGQRVAVYRGRYRADAEARVEIMGQKFPGSEPKLEGRAGDWTVSRSLLAGERREEIEYRGFHS